MSGGQVVDDGDLVTGCQEMRCDDAADISGTARYEQPHAAPSTHDHYARV
jgi:hypothetical protein